MLNLINHPSKLISTTNFPEITVTILSNRRIIKPFGLNGGYPGKLNQQAINLEIQDEAANLNYINRRASEHMAMGQQIVGMENVRANYPDQQRVVERNANKHNLPYYCQKNYADALWEHGKMLYQLGRAA